MTGSSNKMEILTPGEGRMGILGSFIVTLLIVAAIILATVFFVVRTDGARVFLSERLGRYLGTELSIKGARIGWPYTLIIDEPATREFDEGLPCFKAQSVRFSLAGLTKWRVGVHRAELNLVQDARGEWMPPFFGRIGDLPGRNIAHLSHLTAKFRDRWTVDISDSVIRWRDPSGKETASVTGLYFLVSPIKVPARRMHYCRLSLHTLATERGAISDMDREWLLSETDPYLELSSGGKGKPSPPGSWFSVMEKETGEVL